MIPLLLFSTLIIFLLSRYYLIKGRYTQEAADRKSRDETDSEIQDRFVNRLASLIRIPTVSWTATGKKRLPCLHSSFRKN